MNSSDNPGTTGDVQYVWATPDDQPALLKLFAQAFGADMPAALWAWKYHGEVGASMLARRDGEAIAHYGGQSRCMLVDGRPLQAMQIGDSMAKPRDRAALGRNGTFARIVGAFTDAVTEPNGNHAFVYGFPSPRATRLGALLEIYTGVDRLDQLSWSAADGAHSARVVELPLGALRQLGDSLWQRQAHAMGTEAAMVVRDKAFLEQRYLQHPLHDYEVLGYRTRWLRRLESALVFRAHEDALELIDLLGEPVHYAQLLEALRHLAAQRGKTRVFGWATPRVRARLPTPVEQATIHQVTIAGPRSAQYADALSGRCWMTAGDTDYR